MPAKQSKNFCLTINNWNENHLDMLESLPADYVIAGKEIGESGTPHLQCFVRFSKPKTLFSVIKLVPGAHCEMAKGNCSQAIAYCRKEDSNPFEYGKPPSSQGSAMSEKWTTCRRLAEEGRFDEIDDDLYTRYRSTYHAIAKDKMVKPDPISGVCGLWVHGDSGTGKSHAVITQHPDRYIKPLNKWWDGYQNEDVIHIDEIAPSHAAWIAPYLKKWADKWPFDAEIKGGSLQLRPKLIVVTSNHSLDSMGFDPVDLPALQRRFRVVQKQRDQDIIIA